MKPRLTKQSVIVSIFIWIGILLLVLFPIFLLAYTNASSESPRQDVVNLQAVEASPTREASQGREETPVILTQQPSPTSTPAALPTLLPPPTFEPPTATPSPSPVPLPTDVPTLDLNVGDIRINGLETPTLTAETECKPRDDWKLTYTIQAFDTLSSIADRYQTTPSILAEGNCLENPDLIVIGQALQVPGDAPPPQIECVDWEVLTPINHAYNIDGSGTISFVWRGPRAPRNLLRVLDSDGNIALEVTTDLAQNVTIHLPQDLPNEGTYTWFIFPLDWNFLQIPCREGGPWTFHKSGG